MNHSADYTATPLKLDFKLLGGLRIEANGVPCEIKGKRSHQVLMLLEFMIAHRFSKTADQQFADILWGNQDEDKEIKNPTGALKNLVWRCRKLLRESLPPEYADDLILLSGNTYQFNNTYPCTIDIEELDRLYATLSAKSPASAERRGLLEKAVELYHGDFLPELSEFDWAAFQSTYYKRIYLSCVNDLLQIYLGRELFEKAIILSETAMQHEQHDEKIHAAYIQALAGINRVDMAVIHYEHIVKMFYRDLGVSVSRELSDFFRETKQAEKIGETSIGKIVSEVDEDAMKPGGFYCSFEVLKNIYRVIYRNAKRNQQCLTLLALTVQSKMDLQPMADFMEELQRYISFSIRTADCFARYSVNQYLILLPKVDNSNISIIKKRLSKATSGLCKKNGMSLSCTFVEKANPEDFAFMGE